MIYLQLFISFIQVGLFSIGGGYAAMPFIQNEVVTTHSWLTMSEFADLITIAEMTPGPIAINSATFVGIRIAGIPGAIISTFGCILPSLFIVSFLAFIYYRYKNVSMLQSILTCLRPAVVALIASAGISILQMVAFNETITTLSSINWTAIFIFIIAFIALRKYKYNPIFVMLACGFINLFVSLL